MSPELGRQAFRIAFFITLLSAVVVFFQAPGTAGFVVSVTSLVIGLIFIAVIVIWVKRSNR